MPIPKCHYVLFTIYREFSTSDSIKERHSARDNALSCRSRSFIPIVLSSMLPVHGADWISMNCTIAWTILFSLCRMQFFNSIRVFNYFSVYLVPVFFIYSCPNFSLFWYFFPGEITAFGLEVLVVSNILETIAKGNPLFHQVLLHSLFISLFTSLFTSLFIATQRQWAAEPLLHETLRWKLCFLFSHFWALFLSRRNW